MVLLSRNEPNPEQILIHYIPLDKKPGDDYIGAQTRTLENFMEEITLEGIISKRFTLVSE